MVGRGAQIDAQRAQGGKIQEQPDAEAEATDTDEPASAGTHRPSPSGGLGAQSAFADAPNRLERMSSATSAPPLPACAWAWPVRLSLAAEALACAVGVQALSCSCLTRLSQMAGSSTAWHCVVSMAAGAAELPARMQCKNDDCPEPLAPLRHHCDWLVVRCQLHIHADLNDPGCAGVGEDGYFDPREDESQWEVGSSRAGSAPDLAAVSGSSWQQGGLRSNSSTQACPCEHSRPKWD